MLPLCDLQKTIHAVPLAFSGQWDFGLKSVAKNMSNYAPEFSLSWPEELGGGMSAMLEGWEMYQTSDDPLTSPQRKLLSAYLQTDVYSMHQLLSWMRSVAVQGDHPPTTPGERPKRKPAPRQKSRKPKRRSKGDSIGWYRYALEAVQDCEDLAYAR